MKRVFVKNYLTIVMFALLFSKLTYSQEKSLGILVLDKENLNEYDHGFLDLVSTLNFSEQFDTLGIKQISESEKDLNSYDIIIANGVNSEAELNLYNISDKVNAAANSGVNFILGSSGAIVMKWLGLGNLKTSSWHPVLDDTGFFISPNYDHPVTKELPEFWDYSEYSVSELNQLDTENVIFRVKGGQSYSLAQLDWSTISPYSYLATHAGTGFEVSDTSKKGMPFWLLDRV